MINPPHAPGFIDAVGKFIINFGGVELLSLAWVTVLAEDGIILDLAVDMPLSRRIGLLQALIDRAAPNKKWQRSAKRGWEEISRLAEIRNVVAHGPVVFAWKGKDTAGAPEIVGIPVLKHMKAKYGRKLPTITEKALRSAIDEVVAGATVLQDLFDEFKRLEETNGARGTAT